MRGEDHLNNFDFSLDYIINEINEKKYKTVAIQLPEGLKIYALKLADYIEEKTDCKVIIDANPCYGACDVNYELENLVDVVFHFAHNKIVKSRAIFLDTKANISLDMRFSFIENYLRGRKIGLVASIQYVHLLRHAKEILEKKGYEVKIGRKKGRVKYDGQILGCYFETAKNIDVDEYIYIGTGKFHAIGLAISTGKRVLIYDPVLKKIYDVSGDVQKILKIRYSKILEAKIKNPKKIGIIIGAKKGQQRLKLAFSIGEKLKKYKIKPYYIFLNEIKEENLLSFDIDVFVNTACPRVTIDDAAKFKKIILTPNELDIMLGEKEKYEMDEFK